MLHGDEADVAAHYEEAERHAALQRMLFSQQQEQPDEDAHGRYCLDCAETIPPERVQAINAVRCVECARRREKRRHLGLVKTDPLED
ncbi:MAG: TraR/DksA C4-type zinc finger protein [Acidithiobacillus sp.]|jgi:RNA polymerase-binding transcription factor DksA|nr:TraR/DksA C4-type zinc finger protein [Acidithiobacillus sp.]